MIYQVRGPVVQEGERLAEALLTNHQVCQQQRVVTMILMKFYLGAGESGEPSSKGYLIANEKVILIV